MLHTYMVHLHNLGRLCCLYLGKEEKRRNENPTQLNSTQYYIRYLKPRLSFLTYRNNSISMAQHIPLYFVIGEESCASEEGAVRTRDGPSSALAGLPTRTHARIGEILNACIVHTACGLIFPAAEKIWDEEFRWGRDLWMLSLGVAMCLVEMICGNSTLSGCYLFSIFQSTQLEVVFLC